MGIKLPWWMRDAEPEEKRLYFAGCPRELWPVELEDLPTPSPILYERGSKDIRITIKEQRAWMQRVAKEMTHPHKVLIASDPTDMPGLALLTIWCKNDNLNLIDLGTLPRKEDIPDTALGLYNMTADATADRVQAARDLLYRYKDRFVALCISGMDNPMEYAYNVLRFYKFNAIFHLDGRVAIDRKRTR